MLNTISLSVVHHGQSEEFSFILEIANLTFTIIFALEAVLKLIALGPKVYFSEGFNSIDFFVILCAAVGLVEIIVLQVEFGQDGTSKLASVLTTLRIFRLVRVCLLGKSNNLKALFATAAQGITPVLYMSLLLMVYIYMFAILGVQIFAGKFDDLNPKSTLANFDNLLNSALSIFQLQTGDDWPNLMDHMYTIVPLTLTHPNMTTQQFSST